MKKTNREALDAYYQEAGSWAADQISSLRASRKVAWVVAVVAIGVVIAETIALILMMPLKTVVPYTLMVDRNTGYVQVLKPLEPNSITPDAALVQSMLVQYVIARESFDASILQDSYRKVGLWSADQARTDYLNLMPVSNIDSPLNVYPRETTVDIRVKSVSRMSAQSALVRFDSVRRDKGGQHQAARPWVAIVEYRFSGEPASAEDRFLNPLGFQVIGYRRDPEALNDMSPEAPQTQQSIDAVPLEAAEPGVSVEEGE